MRTPQGYRHRQGNLPEVPVYLQGWGMHQALKSRVVHCKASGHQGATAKKGSVAEPT